MNAFSYGFGPANHLAALNAFNRNLLGLNNALASQATGLRINRAADDPAGLIASENFRAVLAAIDAETRVLERQELRAASADAALGQISDLLVEANGLAVANANEAGLSDAEREANQMSIDATLAAIDRIATTTTFAGERLLDGTAQLAVQDLTHAISSVASGDLGAIDVDGTPYTLADLGTGLALNLVDGDLASGRLAIDTASGDVAEMRAGIGAFTENTVGGRLHTLSVMFQNVSAAESMIRDADHARVAADVARFQTLLGTSRIALGMTIGDRGRIVDLLG